MMLGAICLVAFPATRGGEPEMPLEIDSSSLAPQGLAPDYTSLLADQEFTVAALFGRMNDDEEGKDYGQWSYEQFLLTLAEMGLERVTGDRQGWTRFTGTADVGLRIHVDVLGPEALPQQGGAQAVGAALRQALEDHELVYFNGHSFGGAISALEDSETFSSAGYGMLVLDTCWSTQHYGVRALHASDSHRIDIIVNDRQSVTGSVVGFGELLAGVMQGVRQSARNQSVKGWQELLSQLNRAAEQRAAQRRQLVAKTAFPEPERYRLAQFRTW